MPPAPSLQLGATLLSSSQAHRDCVNIRRWFPQCMEQIEIIAVWKTVLQKTVYPIILNITISSASLCWNEERGIHLINYEEQPDSTHSFIIVLGSATACDDTLNAFATE